METVLVTAIVLTAALLVTRHVWKKFRAPEKNCCGGGCCSRNNPLNQKEKS
ncbi:MAG: FeoB-associated Cys-rich membrane protein [Syntrophotaleaceae bacterium]